MTFVLLAAAVAAPPGSDWKFIDESARDGRSVVTFRTVELADTPTRPLHPDDMPPAGAKFGSVGLGPGGRHRLGVVWHPGTAALWFDADGDGRYSAAERVTLGTAPHEAKVSVPFGEGAKQDRTVMIRKRGEGLAWAVRGYTLGTLTLNGKKVPAILTDGDADGCFDGAGSDRVWLDLDGDGRFDPLTEQFPLGTAITAAGTAVLVRPQPDGLSVQARERPAETGTLTVDVVRLPKTEVIELVANYVSEFGELVVVRAADKPVSLPAGKYRVDSVRLKLADPDGKVWTYTFSTGDRAGYAVEIARGKETVHKLLDGLKVTVSASTAGGVVPGTSVQVQPDVVAAGGLYMTGCHVGDRFAEYGREVLVAISLTEPGSVELDRCASGFH
jgi:hypothetical protein